MSSYMIFTRGELIFSKKFVISVIIKTVEIDYTLHYFLQSKLTFVVKISFNVLIIRKLHELKLTKCGCKRCKIYVKPENYLNIYYLLINISDDTIPLAIEI